MKTSNSTNQMNDIKKLIRVYALLAAVLDKVEELNAAIGYALADPGEMLHAKTIGHLNDMSCGVNANAESIKERLSAYEAANIIRPKPTTQEVGV